MSPLLIDIARLTVWLFVLALIFAPLERVFMLRKAKARASILVDLGYFYLNGLVPTLFMAVPLALLASGMRALTPAAWHDAVTGLPLWASVGLGLIVAELGS